jgi:hypothetical protein
VQFLDRGDAVVGHLAAAQFGVRGLLQHHRQVLAHVLDADVGRFQRGLEQGQALAVGAAQVVLVGVGCQHHLFLVLLLLRPLVLLGGAGGLRFQLRALFRGQRALDFSGLAAAGGGEFPARLVHRFRRKFLVVVDLAVLVDPAVQLRALRLRVGDAGAKHRRQGRREDRLAVHFATPVSLLP